MAKPSQQMTKEEMKRVVMSSKRDLTRIILGISVAMAVVFVILGVLNMTNPQEFNHSMKALKLKDTNLDGVVDRLDINAGYDSNGDEVPDQAEYPIKRLANFVVFAMMVIIGPYAFYKSKQDANVVAIERRLPEFLRDVAEAGRFGMTLADAIVVAANGRYGKLTVEIKKMAAQIEWGVPASEALRLFAVRINTPGVNRLVAVIIKASDAGGNVADVLTMVSHDARETQLTKDERAISMSTYLAVVYISFFVFLVTIIILNATFLPKIREAGTMVTRASAEAGISSGMATLDVTVIPQIELAFFVSSMIHAVGDGIMAGVLTKGKVAEGLKHSFILLLLGFVVLQVT
jgi:flagellar protein FlaJ